MALGRFGEWASGEQQEADVGVGRGALANSLEGDGLGDAAATAEVCQGANHREGAREPSFGAGRTSANGPRTHGNDELRVAPKLDGESANEHHAACGEALIGASAFEYQWARQA